MSGAQRTGGAVLLAAALSASAWSLWGRRSGPAPAAPATATPTSASATPPTATPLHAPRGYRLAGVAVGEPESFAVVEMPNGTHVLYRIDADIPGLGRLARIEAERIIVDSDASQIEMWLAPAATPSPTRVRAATARAAAAATRTAPVLEDLETPTPKPPPADASTPESTPSVAPGSPVS